ncbi:hypothetical protein CP973_26785 [Streptomyces albofaciens JCM 4342]|nr:hypothetical protein CP973_26785 [Streptomyces albofaciens JCM 4342]
MPIIVPEAAGALRRGRGARRAPATRRRRLRPLPVGQGSSPPRPDDPGTDGRRYVSGRTGCIGLQVRGASDALSYRGIRVEEL